MVDEREYTQKKSNVNFINLGQAIYIKAIWQLLNYSSEIICELSAEPDKDLVSSGEDYALRSTLRKAADILKGLNLYDDSCPADCMIGNYLWEPIHQNEVTDRESELQKEADMILWNRWHGIEPPEGA